MKTQLKWIGLIVGLAVVAGVGLLAGQLSAPSWVSAQGAGCVPAQHSGSVTFSGSRSEETVIWEGLRTAFIAFSVGPDTTTRGYGTILVLDVDGRRYERGAGGVVASIGRVIKLRYAPYGYAEERASASFTITTSVPCS